MQFVYVHTLHIAIAEDICNKRLGTSMNIGSYQHIALRTIFNIPRPLSTTSMQADTKHCPLILEHPLPHPSMILATFGEEGTTPTQLTNYPVSEMTYKWVVMEMVNIFLLVH